MIGFRQRVTLKRRGKVIGEDAHGNPIYGADVETTYYGHVRPLTSEERFAEGLAGTVTPARIYLPPQARALTAADKVWTGGYVWQVVGNPSVHRVGTQIHHLEAVVKRFGIDESAVDNGSTVGTVGISTLTLDGLDALIDGTGSAGDMGSGGDASTLTLEDLDALIG